MTDPDEVLEIIIPHDHKWRDSIRDQLYKIIYKHKLPFYCDSVDFAAEEAKYGAILMPKEYLGEKQDDDLEDG